MQFSFGRMSNQCVIWLGNREPDEFLSLWFKPGRVFRFNVTRARITSAIEF